MIKLQSVFFEKNVRFVAHLKATESAAFVSYTLDCTNFGGVNRGQQQLGQRNGSLSKMGVGGCGPKKIEDSVK